MRIAEYHTYFIGRDEWGFSIWTHNSCYKAYADSYGSFMIRRFNNGQIEQLLDSSGNAIRFETLEEAEAAAARLNAPKAGSVPRAKVVGVPESSDVVTLWKAPGKGRTGAASEVTNGFDPAKPRTSQLRKVFSGPMGTVFRRSTFLEASLTNLCIKV
jgi:hypothetical protein